MQLMRIGQIGHERPVLLADNRHYLLSPIVGDIDRTFWMGGGLDRIRKAMATGSLREIDVEGERIGAPIARPGAVICIGMNYEAHARETGAELPKDLVMFYKPSNTVVGPNDTVLIPIGSTKTDWEVELGVVIGKRARYLASPREALECVAGYSISNDVSEREYQLERSGGQWSKGKSFETFNPLGPMLVTSDEITNPQALRIRSSVNGQIRQDSSTSDMAIGVASLIWQLSQVTVLEPGDLVNTGTPEGVALSGRFPYLREGDSIAMEIEQLGTQRQTARNATIGDPS